MLLRPLSLFGILLTLKFSLLGRSPTSPPLELPQPTPGPLPYPLGLWYPAPACPLLPVHTPHSHPCWILVSHPGIPLVPAGCPSHSPGSGCPPHPAVPRHPSVAHWVSAAPGNGHLSSLSPPNGFRTELFWEAKGKGPYKILVNKFTFRGWGDNFPLIMSLSFTFWKYSHHAFLKFFLHRFLYLSMRSIFLISSYRLHIFS